MKNKKSLYVLLPAAAGLWAYIIYLAVSGMGSGNDFVPSAMQPMVFNDSLVMQQDSFVLSLAYDDPFLKKIKKGPGDVSSAPRTIAISPKPKPPKVVAPSVSWPIIEYGGNIAGAGTKKEVIILVIANQEVLGKEGDVLKGGVKIVHLTPDAIELEYNGDSKTINR